MAILPKKPKKVVWTFHSRNKMRQYRLSDARVLRIIHSPTRIEDGVADKTIAFMQKAGSKDHPHELWVMVQDVGVKRKIISAWRYPGTTKSRGKIALNLIRSELDDFMTQEAESTPLRPEPKVNKWFKSETERTKIKKLWPKRKFRSFKDIKLGRSENT
ncbi:MAG: hypothetical protein V1856_00800 [Candidatus Liptonbacteria bacterium]